MKQKSRMSIRYVDELVEGIDYEIVSYVVLDNSDQFQTVESFFGIDQLELINLYPNQKVMEEVLQVSAMFNRDSEDFKYMSKMKMLKEPVYFYRLNDLSIDLDLLVSLGFGLVRILTEDAYGELWFFDSFYFRNLLFENRDDWESPLIGDTAIRFNIYYSLKDPSFEDRDLEYLVNMNEDIVKNMCLCNGDRIVGDLREVFAKKKGGNNIISFPSKI